LSFPAFPGPIRAGEALAEALHSFQDQGTRLIYSTQTVTAQMRVLAPPAGASVEEQLTSLLAPHHLGLKPIEAGGWIIVSASKSPTGTGVLKIIVVDDHRSPVRGARVKRRDSPVESRSDSSGIALMENLPSGDFPLEVSADGYRALTRNIHFRATGDDPAAEILMTPQVERLEEVIVETSRYGLERANADGSFQSDRSLLTAMPDTDEDVARSLQQFPGVASNGLSGRTHVRGGREDETVFRFDGVTLFDPFHLKNFQGLFSAIDPAVTDSVTYWAGSFPIELSGSIGGIVDVSPRRPTAPSAEAGVSVIDSSLMFATPFAEGRGSILVSGRMGNLSEVVRLLDRDIGEPEFSDLTARATWDLNDRTHLVAGVLGLDDSISLSTDDPVQRATAGYRDAYSWLKMRGEWIQDLQSETLLTHATLGLERNAQVTRLNISNGFLNQMSSSSVNSLRQELSWVPTPGLNLRLGGEFSRAISHDALQSDAVFQPPFAPGIQPEPQISRNLDVHTHYSTLSIYGAARWRIARNSIVEFGLRRDGQNFQEENERSQWNARVSLRHEFDKSTALRLAWGQFSQPEAIGRLDIADGVTDLESARRLNQLNASIEHTFGDNTNIRIEAYDKHEGSSKLTYESIFSPLVLTQEIEVDRLAFNSMGARMRGVELSVQSDQERPLSASATYSYSTAFDRIGGVDVPRSWSQPHSLQASVLWKRGPWQLASFANWHSGWPFTPLTASSLTWQNPNAVTLALGPRNSARHVSFQTLDLRASWSTPLRHGSLEASLELKNALNADNECCRTFQVVRAPNGSAMLIEKTRDWLRLLPLIGIRWRL
jgi:hypothetical protein